MPVDLERNNMGFKEPLWRGLSDARMNIMFKVDAVMVGMMKQHQTVSWRNFTYWVWKLLKVISLENKILYNMYILSRWPWYRIGKSMMRLTRSDLNSSRVQKYNVIHFSLFNTNLEASSSLGTPAWVDSS